METKYYKKRNIHHPVLRFDGKQIDWVRVGNSGVISTDDDGLIKYLDEAGKDSRGAVESLTKVAYDQHAAVEKKTLSTVSRRTFPSRPIVADGSRSAASRGKFATPPSVSPPQVADHAESVHKRQAKKAVSSRPIVEPPPGVSGVSSVADDTPEP